MIYLNTLAYEASLEAVLPTYDHHGKDSCKVFYSNGTSKTVQKDITRFIMEWLHAHKVNLIAQRMWSWELLGRESINPIIIDEHTALIPVKTREVRNPKDSCHGYIVQHSIKYFDQHHILLHSGARIPYLATLTTLREQILDANALNYVYKTDLMQPV